MFYDESVSYFKHLETLEEIRRTNGPSPVTLPVDNKKIVCVTSGVDNSSKNPKSCRMRCHYSGKIKYKMSDHKEIVNSKQTKKAHFEAKAGSDLERIFEEINSFQRQLKPEKTATCNNL
jgi:hypothetical protein